MPYLANNNNMCTKASKKKGGLQEKRMEEDGEVYFALILLCWSSKRCIFPGHKPAIKNELKRNARVENLLDLKGLFLKKGFLLYRYICRTYIHYSYTQFLEIFTTTVSVLYSQLTKMPFSDLRIKIKNICAIFEFWHFREKIET